MRLIEDLFKGVNNQYWDLGRIASFWTIFTTSAIAAFKLYHGHPLTLPEYASSMMYVLTGCVIFIGGKDLALAAVHKMSFTPPGDK